MSVPVGPNPVNTSCPSCRHPITTQVKHEPTTKTHIIALILCLCLCLPCVCIPYCTDSCRNANHYCPKCEAFIGSYES